MSKQLNLKWVSDTIGDEYKKWKVGDVVTINSQTGTGKNYFITGDRAKIGLVDTVEEWENILYICNRIELKRQVKQDLLKKYGMEINYVENDNGQLIVDTEWLDEVETIKNVTIKSYHSIAFNRKERSYGNGNYYLDKYKYIVCDECQFFLTDAGFNQYTYYAFTELIKERNSKSIMIYLSATIEEIAPLIDEAIENWKTKFGDIWFGNWAKCNKWEYNTGIDYNYLNVKYFKNINTIAQLIKNRRTEKWVIFVTSEDSGKELEEGLLADDIEATFIKAGKESDEKKMVTTNSTFNSQVLIATKCIDNGVNIKDKSITNLVVMAYDKTTFIQEIGRLRLNIKDAHNINLYIRCCYKKTFLTLLNEYEKKEEMVKLFNEDIITFKSKFNNNYHSLPQDIFYLNNSNEWCLNELGIERLNIDIKFATKMVEKFKKDKNFAFIKEQLSWLNLEDIFDKNNLIEDVVDEGNVEMLRVFLEEAYENNDRMDKEIFTGRVTDIVKNDENLKVLFNKISGNGNRQKGAQNFNKLFEKVELPYIVGSKKFRINGKLETKWIVISV